MIIKEEKNMFNKLLEIRKEINEIKSLLSPLDYNKVQSDSGHKELQDAMNKTIIHRNNIINTLSTEDGDELTNAISFIGKMVYEDIEFRYKLFNLSLLKFCIYEIMLYCLSNVLAAGRYDIFYTIATNKYYVSGVNENTYSTIFGLGFEHICNIREINGEDDDSTVFKLINSRLDTSLSSLDELVTCDMVIRDISVLNEDNHYCSYAAFWNLTHNDTPKNVLLIKRMIKNNDPKAFTLFGCKTKEILNEKIASCGRSNFDLLR